MGANWAEVERPRRRSIDTYNRLYQIHQRMTAFGEDTPVEMVFGHQGFMDEVSVEPWAVDIYQILLGVKRVEVHLQTRLRDEVEIWTKLHIAGAEVLQVEKGSLVANKRLGSILRAHRRAGTQIIAVSDTTLPTEGVSELIQHFHGPELVDHVYMYAAEQ